MDKPRLTQVAAPVTFEKLIALSKALSGREPTPEEIEMARERWDQIYPPAKP